MPVIITVYVAAIVELQVRVANPAPVMVPGVIGPHVRPAGTVSVRVTVPLKPLSAVTVMVDVAEDPTATAAGDDAAIEKSWTVNVAVVE